MTPDKAEQKSNQLVLEAYGKEVSEFHCEPPGSRHEVALYAKYNGLTRSSTLSVKNLAMQDRVVWVDLSLCSLAGPDFRHVVYRFLMKKNKVQQVGVVEGLIPTEYHLIRVKIKDAEDKSHSQD